MRWFNALPLRALRGWLLAAGLVGGVQVADASTYPNRDAWMRFQAEIRGAQTTLGVGTPGTAVPTEAPGPGFHSSPAPARTGGPISVAPAASGQTGLRYGGRALVPLAAGRQLPVDIVGRILQSNLAKAGRAFVTGPLWVAAAAGSIAVPFLLAWLDEAGLAVEDGEVVKSVTIGYWHDNPTVPGPAAGPGAYHPSAMAACNAYIASQPTWWCVEISNNGTSAGYELRSPGGLQGYRTMMNYAHWFGGNTVQNVPATPQDVEDALMEANAPPGVVREFLENGQPVGIETPTVTGPSSTPGPQSQKKMPDGKIVTQTTTHNHSYDGATITTTITNITNNYDPVTDTTETTEEETEPEDERRCKENDMTAGCAELDEPEGEIPKRTETLDFDGSNLFGMGQCPADVKVSIGGAERTAIDFSGTVCPMVVTYVRPLVIALATFMALMILIPGARPE